MATMPTLEDVESEILRIFSKGNVRPGEMLLAQSFIANLDHSRFRAQDLTDGFNSLLEKGAIELKADKSPYAIFLTQSGFDRMPSNAPHDSTVVTPANTTPSPTYNVSGLGARVYVGSTDHSVNSFNINSALLDKVVSDLEALPDHAGKEEAVKAARELKEHQGKSTFGEKYRSFLSTISKSVTVFQKVAPYLGDIADLFS